MIHLEGGTPSLFEQVGEENLRLLLWRFYAKVMQDEQLAPVFAAKLGGFPHNGWPVHIARLEGFWRAMLRGPSDYKGRPAAAHIGLGIGAEHFERWLKLWQETLTEVLPPAQAEVMLAMAQRLGGHFQRMISDALP